MGFDAQQIDGRRLAQDWELALDAAVEALSAQLKMRTLGALEAAAATQQIRDDRQWLAGFTPMLHRLFPSSGDEILH